MSTPFLSRRSFLALSAMLPLSLRALAATSIPVGLELYSVRNALKDDLTGTVRTVAQVGYQCVEFYAPYFDWTDSQTKEMRKLLDELGLRCFSTHNSSSYFTPENLKRAADMNLTLGSKYVIMSSSQPKPGLDGWKDVADTLNAAADQLAPAGLKTGYHNHELEFTPVDGKRPIEILAKNTKPSIALQFDIGTCLKAGSERSRIRAASALLNSNTSRRSKAASSVGSSVRPIHVKQKAMCSFTSYRKSGWLIMVASFSTSSGWESDSCSAINWASTRQRFRSLK